MVPGPSPRLVFSLCGSLAFAQSPKPPANHWISKSKVDGTPRLTGSSTSREKCQLRSSFSLPCAGLTTIINLYTKEINLKNTKEVQKRNKSNFSTIIQALSMLKPADTVRLLSHTTHSDKAAIWHHRMQRQHSQQQQSSIWLLWNTLQNAAAI